MKHVFPILVCLGAALVALSAWGGVRGDADDSGTVDIDDVNVVINVMLRKATLADYPAADFDGNGVVDIDDLNIVVNVMVGKDPGTAVSRTFTVNGVTFKMIGVQGGTFTMGATEEQGSDANENEKPTHEVSLSDYYIGETEVTQKLWVAVMGSNPSYFSSSNGFATNLQRPVEYVNWSDCQMFIAKLNQLTGESFRLPTEAEWEYAARGGSKSQGCKYAGGNSPSKVAWYYYSITSHSPDNPAYGTQTVATKLPNELGLYDMSGNVWERCQDWYGSYSDSEQTNPTGPATGSYRVCRGGGWRNYASSCRVTNRGYGSTSFTSIYLGLRLALESEQP